VSKNESNVFMEGIRESNRLLENI